MDIVADDVDRQRQVGRFCQFFAGSLCTIYHYKCVLRGIASTEGIGGLVGGGRGRKQGKSKSDWAGKGEDGLLVYPCELPSSLAKNLGRPFKSLST